MSFCILGLRIGLIAFILPLICPFLLSFWTKCVSHFSQGLFKLEYSNMEYICRLSDCIVGLSLRLIVLILLLSIFLSSQVNMLT